MVFIPFFRIWASFLLHRKSKLAVVPLCVIAFFLAVCIFGIRDEFQKLFWDVFKSLAEVTNAVFGGNVEEFKSCLLDLENGALRYAIDVIGSLWLWIVPIGLLAYRWFRGELQSLSISRKRAVGLLGYMVVIIFIILLAN